ncbi:MAG: hypothetical protein HYX42_14360 [Polaromonas sp.]|uniref:hypothetical protein n=1 Tax=Polaromonas sp. TaxID=1869339 RepID=UPI0025D4FE8A|nr:hypothetical protein [Polaromonas sp.]MBI2727422.1 hypothetical protein [Polaromonas sp.]
MHTNKIVRVDQIFLDNNNPRHDPIDSEPEIIAYLLKEESVKPLAKSIAKLGSTSPLERVAVVPHPKVKDKFISAEGNRRICALKLLADPSKSGSEANRKYFQSLSDSMGTAPKSVDAVIFDSAISARPWLSLRHEGPQGGVGTRQWNSGQKTRFNMQGDKTSNPNVQAALLMDYAKKHSLTTDAQHKKLKISTLTRYLTNPVFRHTVGLTDNRSLTVHVPKEEFDKIAKRFLLDATADNSAVNSRTNVQQRIDYANQLRKDGLAPSSNIDPVDLSDAPVAPKSKGGSGKRDNTNPDNRRHVIPSTFTAHIKEPILKRLYDELKKLDAEEHSFAAVYLLRAVIEQAAATTLQKAGIAPPTELHKKLGRVADLLQKKGWNDRQVKNLRVMANDVESRYSPDSIGHFVHGGKVPTRTDSIKLWDSLQDVMTELITPTK